jgi:ribose 5-phosphate isomerase B
MGGMNESNHIQHPLWKGAAGMDIIIGCDHGGFELKEDCKAFLQTLDNVGLKDVGVFSTDSVDYPSVAQTVAKAVAEGQYPRGILICGSGIGMSIAANRYKGVRAALCYNLYAARMCREHNNANILVMGGRVMGIDLALEIVACFLRTEFQGARHQRRIDQIDTLGK